MVIQFGGFGKEILGLLGRSERESHEPRLSPKRFSSVDDDDDVQHEVLLWMRQQHKEFYATGIGALIKRWDKCINFGGDYVEK
ncbi:hypothetical protein AVEN_99757-1 [Araneus ventricosus]|uniref:Uncharacterized protein n=1 Tax=Araneus ventricosus TaxID=182803 RepID=A0A4Y2DM10_ARAVE|nr:hypothetical protein AVEN_99757-1 [Araneus ventricosus]